MGQQWTFVGRVTISTFFSKEKACFVCFCRLYVLLQLKRNLVNKQTGSTGSTAINGSQICYITFRRLALLFVGTIPARTKDISKNILSWFWTLFKKFNTLHKRQKRKLNDLQKEYCALGTQTRFADIDKHLCREIEISFFAGKICPKTLYSDKIRLQRDT